MMQRNSAFLLTTILFCQSSVAREWPDDLDGFARAMQEKRQSVKCVWYRVSGKTIIPKESSRSSDGNRFPPQDVVRPFEGEYLIDFENGQFQFEFTLYFVLHSSDEKGNYVGKIVDDTHFWVYEKGELHHHEKHVSRYKGGRFSPATAEVFQEQKATSVIKVYITPFFAAHGYFPFTQTVEETTFFDVGLDTVSLEVLGESVAAERPATVFRTKPLSRYQGGHYREFVVDATSERDVLEIREYYGFLMEAVKFDYEELQGIRVPKSGTWTQFDIDGTTPRRFITFDVTDFKLNPNYGELRKELELQTGMVYFDLTAPSPEGFIVGENRELIAVQDIARRSRRGSGMSWYVIGLISVITVAVIIKFVLRKPKWSNK